MDAVSVLSRAALAGRLRRTLFFGLTFLTAAGRDRADARCPAGQRPHRHRAAWGWLLFFGLFTWIAGALWTAIAGFGVRLAGRDPAGSTCRRVAGRPLHTRTAIVMPIYNEDPRRVGAGLEAIWTSLAASPSRRPSTSSFSPTPATRPSLPRRRPCGRGWCARYAASGRDSSTAAAASAASAKPATSPTSCAAGASGYECMIVLDADSIMSGAALVTLARAMEAHPQIGILQSLPLPVGRETPLRAADPVRCAVAEPDARRAGSPSGSSVRATTGATTPSCGSRRSRSTARCRACPDGRRSAARSSATTSSRPLSCAAPVTKCGRCPSSSGSWEEVPANVIDYAARDRRWTQGNLQHSRVLAIPGLHPLSRVHLLTGIVSYVSSPMWLALLLLSSLLSAIEAAKRPQYFLAGIPQPVPALAAVPQRRDRRAVRADARWCCCCRRCSARSSRSATGSCAASSAASRGCSRVC